MDFRISINLFRAILAQLWMWFLGESNCTHQLSEVGKPYGFRVGEGMLLHTADGFVLDGCDGALHYEQGPRASYSLYADYFWYELGDMVCIGTAKCRYYCFPKDQAGAIVAKARLAAEELYKIKG